MMNWSKITGFEWDEGNLHKSIDKHGITPQETEEIFFNQPLLIVDDTAHSQNETRYYALGRTHLGKQLFVAFTVRENKIRAISSRLMSRKEREIYEQEKDS